MFSGQIEMSFESRLENVDLAGLAVRGICVYTPFSQEEIYQIELCLVEACNNAVLHAHGKDPDKRVRVALDVGPDRLCLKVADSGLSLDWEASGKGRLDAEEGLRDKGVGLSIIRTVMDDVSYETGPEGNELAMVRLFPLTL